MLWRFLVVLTFVWVPLAPVGFPSDLFHGLRTASSPQQNEEGICFFANFQNFIISVFGSEVRSDKYQVTYCILLWVLGHTSWASWAFLGILLGLPMGTSWASWTHFLGFLGLLGCASWSPEHTSKVSWVCLWLVLGLVGGTQFDGRLRISAHAHHCSVA